MIDGQEIIWAWHDPEALLVARDRRPRSTNLGLPDCARSVDVHEDPERQIGRLIVGLGEDRARGVIGDLVLEHKTFGKPD